MFNNDEKHRDAVQHDHSEDGVDRRGFLSCNLCSAPVSISTSVGHDREVWRRSAYRRRRWDGAS